MICIACGECQEDKPFHSYPAHRMPNGKPLFSDDHQFTGEVRWHLLGLRGGDD